jgi:hypothetical protein
MIFFLFLDELRGLGFFDLNLLALHLRNLLSTSKKRAWWLPKQVCFGVLLEEVSYP